MIDTDLHHHQVQTRFYANEYCYNTLKVYSNEIDKNLLQFEAINIV